MEGGVIFLRLLGPIQVEVEGQPISNFRSHKTLAALGYLAAEQRAVARNYLAELLWPESTSVEGRAHLRRALHDLSQKVPGALLTDYHTVQFNPTFAPNTDLARFEALRAQGDGASLAAAAELCRGQFLEGIAFDDCHDFETWLMVERATWRKRAAAIVERLLDQHVRALRFDMALEAALQLVRLDPWREERYHQAMILLARNGALEQAIRVYKRCRHMLATGLGLEPSAELEALSERLRQWRGRRSGNVSQADSIPGRAPELTAALHQLADPHCRLLTLVGPHTPANSRLATQTAASACDPNGSLFLDGAYVVRLNEATTPAQLWAATAQALGVTSGGAAATMEMVLRRVRDREILLVLDGFDQLLTHKHLLVAMLADAPALKIVATCRERLNLLLERALTLGIGQAGAISALSPRQQGDPQSSLPSPTTLSSSHSPDNNSWRYPRPNTPYGLISFEKVSPLW